MKVLPFDEADLSEWDRLCDSSADAWLFHLSSWVTLESNFFFPGSNASFAVHDGHKIVAVQPLYVATLGLGAWSETLVHSGIHRHTGLALLDGLEPGVIKAVRSVAMRRIEILAKHVSADRIQLNIQNLAPKRTNGECSEIPFWVSGFGYFLGVGIGPGGLAPAPGLATCCADQMVELTMPEESLFSALDESCRRAVRKAQGQCLSCNEGAGDDVVRDYYALAERSAKRTGESLAPRGYYEDLWNALGPQGSCRFLFVCSAGQKIAALLLLIDKGAAHFLGGVSDPEFLPMRVNDFMHWSAIVWAKRQGLHVYRLGPVFPELPDDWPVAKVSRFKGKFGGKSVPIIQGVAFGIRKNMQTLPVSRLRLSSQSKGMQSKTGIGGGSCRTPFALGSRRKCTET
ncbi:MAG: GNAT family N-acetyltransferase [Candidatus Accumulibacter sp.]|uniref:GNAT family N-acetyltransferase n=1 Tax=Candidatus Accumulibacter proximus TaxID=2954385 RepID=A0A935UFG4_9PROT|nr:GNAT family N-acetyltransferase [Candidatus Accumulibacter proximus]